MRLIDLQIEGFGKLNNQRIDFSEGINLISGNNEAGKSTVYACIKAMFYGMVRARGVAALTDTYAHYKPWFAKDYGASLRVEENGHIYRIDRDFIKDPIGCSVYDETAMEAVPFSDRFVRELIGNLSEEAYDNTVSIGKLKADKNGSLSAELKKYIVNMDTTGSHALNCARAKTYLNEQKHKLAEGIDTQAAKKYAVNCSEIKVLENDLRGGAGAVVRASAAGSAVKPEVKSSAQSASGANKEELKAVRTEMETLAEEIKKQREALRSHSIYSSAQVEEAIADYQNALAEYREEKDKKAAGRFRVLYIVSFVLAVAAVIATAYIYGSGSSAFIVLGGLGLALLCLLLGIAFLALCVISKSNLGSKSGELGQVLERYTGYNDVSEDRINRVADKLAELSTAAKDAEASEARLAALTVKAEELEASIQSSENESPAPVMPVTEMPEGDEARINSAIVRINELKAENVLLKEKLKKNDAINDEVDAIDMALEKLDEIADTMKDSLGVHLNAEASGYIKEITKGAYDSMSIDDDLNVYMNTADRMVPVEQVSNGTSDQIYMALRLAGARLVQEGEDRLPLLFDDSFVNYDDDRLAATLVWIVKEYKGQIIVFSCQKREETLLKENGLTFNMIHL